MFASAGRARRDAANTQTRHADGIRSTGACATRAPPAHRGFTLVELIVVIIILGVLAAVAVPRFVNIGTQARIASLQTMGGALMTAAINIHALCTTNCVVNGLSIRTTNDWVDAGDNLGLNEIDMWVNYSGFTPTIQDPWHEFTLDGAPDPTNCWVKYTQAVSPTAGPTISYATSGC